MNIKSIMILSLSLVFFSWTKKEPASGIDELGNKIFNAVQQNEFEAIKQMMVSTADVELTLDHFEMDENKKARVKKSLSEKITTDWDLTISTIEKGFKEIRAEFESGKCKKGVKLHQITSNTSVVNGLPFEIGDLSITFKCGKTVKAMHVEIIKTDSGWYILEKLRLISE